MFLQKYFCSVPEVVDWCFVDHEVKGGTFVDKGGILVYQESMYGVPAMK